MATKLTDLQVRNSKPREKKYTLAAGKGLTLLVMPDGAKYWRLRYRFGGKARWLTVGRPYPETGLKEADLEAMRLRRRLAEGVDPAEDRKAEREEQRQKVAQTFGLAANAWHEFRSPAWKKRTSDQVREYLDKDLLPKFGHRPLDSIRPAELADFARAIEDEREAWDVAMKMRQWAKAIYGFARANGWTTNDPAKDLAALARKRPEPENFAHLPITDLPEFLSALEADTGSPLVKYCAMLALWTANRPGVTRTLKWSELDLEAGVWTIERNREGMKRGYFHVTPLPRQAVEMLREVRQLTGTFEYVFVGRNDPRQPISDGAVAGMFKRIGYRGKQTMHGFRHLVSTALNEMGYEADWVERQLAHGDPDKIRGTYNKAHYLEPRRKMMQDWADHLDKLKASPLLKAA